MRDFTFAQSIRLVFALGWSDFILKYRGSVLGYLWSLIAPLTRFVVMLYVLGPFMRKDIPFYPLYLFLGLIIWEHFVGTTTGCMNMLFDKQAMIQKVRVPRILLIFAVGWTNMIIFLTHILIFIGFAMFLGIPLRSTDVWILLTVVQMSLIALGSGMVLSAYALKFRDIPHLWTVGTSILFWLTPIVYRYQPSVSLSRAFMERVTGVSDFHTWWLFDTFVLFQPLSVLIYDARRIMLYAQEVGIPTWGHTMVFTGGCLVVFFCGMRIFQKRSRYFLQEY